MRLIIGGVGQGKLLYTLKKYQLTALDVAYDFKKAETKKVFNQYHTAVKNALSQGQSPEKLTNHLLTVNPDIIILCDEVGCGVVPIEKEQRLWRETVGRLCCQLAEQAESVERIFCGLSMPLK
jgi:adenosyl cobinamide kinase/adenosyl cobinamide phosphate guanylyltransferase